MKIISAILFFIFFVASDSALSWVRCDVTWQSHVGPLGPYSGQGGTQGEAVGNARSLCEQSNPLNEFKLHCLNNPSNQSCVTLPNGSYVKSCYDCRMEGNILACNKGCKPVMERRILDMTGCNSNVSNKHGDLFCGEY